MGCAEAIYSGANGCVLANPVQLPVVTIIRFVQSFLFDIRFH